MPSAWGLWHSPKAFNSPLFAPRVKYSIWEEPPIIRKLTGKKLFLDQATAPGIIVALYSHLRMLPWV